MSAFVIPTTGLAGIPAARNVAIQTQTRSAAEPPPLRTAVPSSLEI